MKILETIDYLFEEVTQEKKSICIIGDSIMVGIMEEICTKRIPEMAPCIQKWQYRPALHIRFNNGSQLFFIDCTESFRGMKYLDKAKEIDQIIVVAENIGFMEFILAKSVLSKIKIEKEKILKC